ncbi:hypothetical protein Tsp_12608, partial [Trichinella spiralis]
LSGLKFDSVEVKVSTSPTLRGNWVIVGDVIAEVKPGAELCKFFEKNT